MLRGSNVQATDERRISLNGCPGIEFRFAGEINGVCRFYLVGNRVYGLTTAAKDINAAAGRAGRFLTSLELG